MKKIIAFLFCAQITLLVFAQKNDSLSYIVIKIKTEWDYSKKSNFYFFTIDSGNKEATDLYVLKPYQNLNPDSDPVYRQSDKHKANNISSKEGINYFSNTSAVLNYLSGKGWILDHVYINITTENVMSTDSNGNSINYPNTTSEPIYIFKKTLIKE